MKIAAWRVVIFKEDISVTPLEIPTELTNFNQISYHLPNGAYTTLRTYEGFKALRLKEHVHRLEHTAKLAGQPQSLNLGALREAIRQVIGDYPEGEDIRLRLTLDLESEPGMIYITSEKLVTPPPTAYLSGVRAVTCALQRERPESKLTRFIQRAERLSSVLPPGVNEALLVTEDGRVLEGLSSNFFAVRRGVLRTAGSGVLEGTTREMVIEGAVKLNIPLRLQPVTVSEIPDLGESFITSASRGILPVIQIDQLVIGLGQPGEITRRLMSGYSEQVNLEAQAI